MASTGNELGGHKEKQKYVSHLREHFEVNKSACFLCQVKAEGEDVKEDVDFETYFLKRVQGCLVSMRYKILDVLGAGSYGQGWKCHDMLTGDVVFLKTFKWRNYPRNGKGELPEWMEALTHKVQKEMTIAQQGLRTGHFLHSNVVQFVDAQYRGVCTLNPFSGETYTATGFPFMYVSRPYA